MPGHRLRRPLPPALPFPGPSRRHLSRRGRAGVACPALTGPAALTALAVLAVFAAMLAPTEADGDAAPDLRATWAAATPATRAYWRMNETRGKTMRDATGGHSGIVHNVDLRHDGFSGTAYGFNGKSSYVSIPTTAMLNAGDRDVHITFSLKTASVPSKPDYDLFRKGKAQGDEYKVEMMPNGQIYCHFAGSRDSVTVQEGPDLHDGEWHTVSCDKLSDKVVLTVDGTKYTKTKTVGSISNSYDIVVGAYPNGDFYKGVLDELSFSTGRDAVTPPAASFTASPRSRGEPLTVDFTDTSTGRRTHSRWNFDDGSTSTRPHPSHTFDHDGSYSVELTVKNRRGIARTTHTITVEQADDGKPPRVRLVRPDARRFQVKAWRTLHGRASDGNGSGVHHVTVRVIEKRHGHWFAYRSSTHTWVKAATRSRALHRASATRLEPSSIGRFHERLGGLRRGRLVVRFTATDRSGNTSPAHHVSHRLRRR